MLLEIDNRSFIYIYRGSLLDLTFSYGGKIPHPVVLKIFGQLVSGLHHLHENLIVHRDLSFQNILIDSGTNAKIADFGLGMKLKFVTV